MPRLSRHLPPHSEAPFTAARGPDRLWRVLSRGRRLCDCTSGRPAADARRIAAAMNALEHVPTEHLDAALFDRLWLILTQMLARCDVPADLRQMAEALLARATHAGR